MNQNSKIGYYAHSHGSGHLNYANLFAAQFKDKLTIFCDEDRKGDIKDFVLGTEYVWLENEHLDGTELSGYTEDLFSEPSYLHYSPVGSDKILRRSRDILQKTIENNIKLMIVDVSVEIAALCRTSSIPYAYVRMFGDRSDFQHTEAYRGAVFLLAYYPEELEQSDTPEWIKEKTLYLGFISKYRNRVSHITNQKNSENHGSREIAYIVGKGGAEKARNIICKLADENPDIKFNVLGSIGEGNLNQSSNIIYHGHVADLETALQKIDTVIIAPGMNLTSEMIHLKKNILTVPEDRPFGEQHSFAEALDKAGYAKIINNNIKVGGAEKEKIRTSESSVEFSPIVLFKDILERNKWDITMVRKEITKEKRENLSPEGDSVIIIVKNRESHLKNTLIGLDSALIRPDEVIIVNMGSDIEIDILHQLNINIIKLETEGDYLPLAAARNKGAEEARFTRLHFLDVDCIPADDYLIKASHYLDTIGGLQMGMPYYLELPLGREYLLAETRYDRDRLLCTNAVHHPDRPYFDGVKKWDTYEMFWSLCFSIHKTDFNTIGGFDTGFIGYGGEDTDFAICAREKGIDFYLTDAEVFHQQHTVANPPINHLEDIVRNSEYYKQKHNVLPMRQWLEQFSKMGLVEIKEDDSLVLKRKPTEQEVEECIKTDATYV